MQAITDSSNPVYFAIRNDSKLKLFLLLTKLFDCLACCEKKSINNQCS